MTPSSSDCAPLVSLVVPALDEADNMADLVSTVLDYQRAMPSMSFELVLIDDGSQDGTGERLLALAPPSL
jgi:glycosyltransferase involved in cell wall biosynthesis